MFTSRDLTYVSIPIVIMWNPNMSLQKKLGLVVVMSLGLMFVLRTSQLCGISLIFSNTMVASIMKTIISQSNTKTVDSECR